MTTEHACQLLGIVAATGLPGAGARPSSEAPDADTMAELLDLVTAQRIPGYLVAALDSGAIRATPEQRAAAARRHEEALALDLVLERLLAETSSMFAGAGIAHRALKGPAVARHAVCATCAPVVRRRRCARGGGPIRRCDRVAHGRGWASPLPGASHSIHLEVRQGCVRRHRRRSRARRASSVRRGSFRIGDRRAGAVRGSAHHCRGWSRDSGAGSRSHLPSCLLSRGTRRSCAALHDTARHRRVFVHRIGRCRPCALSRETLARSGRVATRDWSSLLRCCRSTCRNRCATGQTRTGPMRSNERRLPCTSRPTQATRRGRRRACGRSVEFGARWRTHARSSSRRGHTCVRETVPTSSVGGGRSSCNAAGGRHDDRRRQPVVGGGPPRAIVRVSRLRVLVGRRRPRSAGGLRHCVLGVRFGGRPRDSPAFRLHLGARRGSLQAVHRRRSRARSDDARFTGRSGRVGGQPGRHTYATAGASPPRGRRGGRESRDRHRGAIGSGKVDARRGTRARRVAVPDR